MAAISKLLGKTLNGSVQFGYPIYIARGTGITCQGGRGEKGSSGVFSYHLISVEGANGFGGQPAISAPQS